MKTLTLFFILFFFQGFSQNPENDSINKKEHKFLFGITLAPNYSWREYYNKKRDETFSYGAPRNDYPSMGYSILLNGKITKRKFVFNIGAGMSFLNYKGRRVIGEFPNNYRREESYGYKHKLYDINTGYNILLGKKKLWSIGISADINYIFSLTQNVKTNVYEWGVLVSEYERTLDFTNRQGVFWGGLEVGRTFHSAKWLNIDISLSAKYSSIINIEYIPTSYGDFVTEPRNLEAFSLNISFYPIFKRK